MATELRISAIHGTAFLDTDDDTFAAELAANLNALITIKDSNNNKIAGWIKAVGTGESYE